MRAQFEGRSRRLADWKCQKCMYQRPVHVTKQPLYQRDTIQVLTASPSMLSRSSVQGASPIINLVPSGQAVPQVKPISQRQVKGSVFHEPGVRVMG
jgi:hypothetical protein